MLISEKNQYSKSGYHPDSSLKIHFHVSKITKNAKIDKKGKSVENLGGVNRGALRDQQGINRGSTGINPAPPPSAPSNTAPPRLSSPEGDRWPPYN